MATINDTNSHLSGKIIVPGVGFGNAHLISPAAPSSSLISAIAPNMVERETRRLSKAISLLKKHMEMHVQEFHGLDESESRQILSMRQLMLEDKAFFSGIIHRIRRDLTPAERAVEQEFNAAAVRLSSSRDAYLRARAEDLRDICQLLRKILIQGDAAFVQVTPLPKDMVFVSPNLHPSSVLRARKSKASAFITSSTANTSHGAILLKASGIPGIGGVDLSDPRFNEGIPILVDAINNEILFDPSEEIRLSAAELSVQIKTAKVHKGMPPKKARTSSGLEVTLLANVDNPSQTPLCFLHQLSGVGLFRTEFMVLDSGRIPDEEEQYLTYKNVIDELSGRQLSIRTFDIGADKVTEGLDMATGANPALGIRGIRRHLLRFPDELRTQLRAIMRASTYGPVAIMLPMVTDIDDVKQALVHKDAVYRELKKNGIPVDPNLPFGVMIEVPSAALNIAGILKIVDFVSIGTNDLMQYLTASDRDNPDVLGYQNIESSGFRLLLKYIMDKAREMSREQDICVCGEIASDPIGAIFLTQMGVTSLSISPDSAPLVRRSIESTRYVVSEKDE